MHAAKFPMLLFVLTSLAEVTLASCTVQTSQREELFDYASNEDSFSKITTSTAAARFPLDDGSGEILLSAKCIHNTSHPEGNELTLTASAVGTGATGQPYLNALIYKLDQAKPVVYRDPQSAFHPASEFPDTPAGSWQQAAANAEEASRIPTSNNAAIYVDLLPLLAGRPKSPETIALRFVHGDPADAGFGTKTVQEYARYRSKDVQIAVKGTNFGRVLTDCRKGG